MRHSLRRRYGRSLGSEVRHGTKVRIKSTHGYKPYRGLTGTIDAYVPFSKYYVHLDDGERILVDMSDLEKR